MKNILYLLLILPTFFSCQSEKNVSQYPFFVGNIQFDDKDFKRCNSENIFQGKSSAQFIYFELKNHDKALENFEKQSKVYDFAENIYFKSKISKIRNKDYLDLKKMALKAYDENKTIMDGYTHHFNKVYKSQIEEL